MQLETWFLYTIAALGLSLSPGPNSLLAMTHGALHGTRMTLFTVAGGALGFIVLIALSMFGIAALIQSSIVWLTMLKWVGGAYLVWLGTEVGLASTAHRIRPWLARVGKRFNRACGGLFMAIGAVLPLRT